jgi:hypothetical protein
VTTPISIIEDYFEDQGVVTPKRVGSLSRVDDDRWLDFAKQYQASSEQSASDLNVDDGKLRLWFDPTILETWSRAVQQLYETQTPLLGLQPDPHEPVNHDAAIRFVQPLVKHLLVADSVCVADNFYQSFYLLAESVPRDATDKVKEEFGVANQVARLKAWLPLLAELRPLIESGALVFFPEQKAPSFPATNYYSVDRMNELGLGIKPSDEPPRPSPTIDFEHFFDEPDIEPRPYDPFDYPGGVNEEAVIRAWLNARLVGQSPVFPHRRMYDFASRLYLKATGDEPDETSLVSDLMTFRVLPIGDGSKPVDIATVTKLRENEEAFTAVKLAVQYCQDRLTNALKESASRKDATAICEQVFQDHLNATEGHAHHILQYLQDNKPAATVLSLAAGVALLPVAPVIGAFVPALVSAANVQAVLDLFNRNRKAIKQLQLLL